MRVAAAVSLVSANTANYPGVGSLVQSGTVASRLGYRSPKQYYQFHHSGSLDPTDPLIPCLHGVARGRSGRGMPRTSIRRSHASQAEGDHLV